MPNKKPRRGVTESEAPKRGGKIEWHTEKRKINDLLVFKKNPRRLTEEQTDQLKKSIEKFNLVEIPAIDTDDKIIAGHQRLAVMKLLGRGGETVDVRVPNRKLTPDEFKEYNLRSNKNTGEWDFEMLGAEFDKDLLAEVGFTESFLLNAGDEVEDADGEYEGMPAFEAGEDIFKTLSVHFKNADDLAAFAELIDQKINEKTKFVFYPKYEKRDLSKTRFAKKP